MTRILQNELLKPGVYVTETDSSQVADVPNAPRNTALFYGVSESGPIGVPVFIDSPKKFIEIFGRPKMSWGLNASHGTWTAYTYVASGAGSIWFVRKQNSATTNQPNLHFVNFTGSTDYSADNTVFLGTEKVTDDWEVDYQNQTTDQPVKLYFKYPVYSVDGIYKDLQVKIRVIDVAKEFDELLSTISNQETAETLKWLEVSIGTDIGTADEDIKEVFIVNNTRDAMSNGLSYWFGRLNRSSYIGVSFADLFEEDAFDKMYDDVNSSFADATVVADETALLASSPTLNDIYYVSDTEKYFKFTGSDATDINDWTELTDYDSIVLSITDSTTTPDVSVDGTDITLQTVPDVSRKEFPFVMVFVPNTVDAGIGAGSVNESIANVINKNQGLVYVIVGKGDGLKVTDYLDNTNQILVNHPNYGKFQSRVFPFVQKMKIFDPFSNKNILIPVSTQAMLIMGFLKETPWLPPAGVARGTVSALNVYPSFDDSEIGRLYNIGKLNCVDRTVNGFYLWGQRTAQKDASALDRINSVRAVVDLEVALETGLRSFIFEIASATTLARMDKYMQDIRRFYLDNEAFRTLEYEIDTSLLEYNQVDIKIRALPTEAIEYINVGVNITREGVTVSEVV